LGGNPTINRKAQTGMVHDETEAGEGEDEREEPFLGSYSEPERKPPLDPRTAVHRGGCNAWKSGNGNKRESPYGGR